MNVKQVHKNVECKDLPVRILDFVDAGADGERTRLISSYWPKFRLVVVFKINRATII